jgi:hypothetical protein
MKRIIALLAGVALMSLTTSAMAIPITGSIAFTGALELVGPAHLNTQNATGIHFDNPGLVTTGATGTYATIPGYPPLSLSYLTPVTFKDFNFALSSGPVNPLWTLSYGGDTFDFILTSVAATRIAPNGLLLNGTGMLQATGYDDTAGSWALTTQDGLTKILSFSATSDDPPVPEPCTLLFLGAGLLALAIFGKRMQEA